jgi:radical SAM superfamily enzyme YgiQ (UPF0313 family)
MADSCNVLMVFPRFNPKSFWSYEGACEILKVGYPLPPLGLITLAALLPPEWSIRLVNRNTEELDPTDLDWADMVMTGGMLNQQFDAQKIIRLAQEAGKPVVVGGPDVTSSPHMYAQADIRVLGEAESIIDEFVAFWDRGERKGLFEAPKFQTDVTKTPIPRFDLLKLEQYLYIGVQFSRGCPFLCEFCDIIELYGRNPRAKTPAQMLAELDALYALGYRGHVDFVDDNLIGNKKAVKAFLPHLIAWQKERRYPFMLTTEASLNLADDDQLLQLLREANFIGIFVGIETPEDEILVQTQKKQNTRRSIPESVRRIYDYGILVAAGFVLGFDSEKEGIAAAMVRCIDDSMIPVANVSLLYALAGTQLTRRLEREGRLQQGFEGDTVGNAGDFVLAGLNFETARPRRNILGDYVSVVSSLYRPEAFFRRARGMVMALDRINLGLPILVRDSVREIDRFWRVMKHVTLHRPDMRWHSWRLIAECMMRNPRAVRLAVALVVFYLYLGPLTRFVTDSVEEQIARLDALPQPSPQPVPRPVAATAA